MQCLFQIVGILNVTPDSYHDGGKFTDVSAAVARVGAMLSEGADWIEIGGESTGPNSTEVTLEQERARVIPVIEAMQKEFPEAKISVDTWKPEVAEASIKAGATMVNDVTAGRGSGGAMFNVLAKSSAKLVLLYSKDATQRTTIAGKSYENVVAEISTFLRMRRDAAVAAGISKERIILDPGLGHFVSSDPKYSFEILARLQEFLHLGCPLFLSPSRKSFLAGSENLKTVDRLPGTIAASALAVLHGASFIRTHDVLEVRRACEIAMHICSMAL